MAVRYEAIWAVVVDGRRVCGYFDRHLAIVAARMQGGHARRCLVECPIDCYGFAILPDWYYGNPPYLPAVAEDRGGLADYFKRSDRPVCQDDYEYMTGTGRYAAPEGS